MSAVAEGGFAAARPAPRILPGFGLSLGIALSYLGFIVLIPMAGLFAKAAGLGWTAIVEQLTQPRALAAFRVSFATAAAAALVNGALGLMIAWVLARYEFPGRRLLDAVIDLPFALPTAVAGITLSTLFTDEGWFGALLVPLGIEVSFTPAGIFVALLFVGFPFVVRTLQPMIADLDREAEEGARSLGASDGEIFRRVSLPPLIPGLLAGIALAFARGLGEYGSVIFIAGNRPGVSEIAPLLIVVKLEQFDYGGASAIAVAMLLAAFVVLLAINLLERWTRARYGG